MAPKKIDSSGELVGGYDPTPARAAALKHAQETMPSVGEKKRYPLRWQVQENVTFNENDECWEVTRSCYPQDGRCRQKGVWLYQIQPHPRDPQSQGYLLPGTPREITELQWEEPKRRPAWVWGLAGLVALGLVGGGLWVALGLRGGVPASPPSSPTSVPTAAPQPTATPTLTSSATATPTPTPNQGERAVKSYPAPPKMALDQSQSYRATMHTTQGDIVFDLLAAEAPKTVNNFVFLARDGFYNGVKFHRIIKGFMIQGGDPMGTGRGGPGYRFEDEPVTRNYLAGTLAMANAGPNTNGSQFFIVHRDANLSKSYTIFGIVVQGMDVVDKIANTPVTRSDSGELAQPTVDVLINSIAIQETARP